MSYELPAFTENHRCEKCHCTDVTMGLYKSRRIHRCDVGGAVDDHRFVADVGEHLLVKCARCSFFWYMAVACDDPEEPDDGK